MSGKLVEVVCTTCGRMRYIPAAMRRKMAKRWRCLECRCGSNKSRAVKHQPEKPAKQGGSRPKSVSMVYDKTVAFEFTIVNDPDPVGGYRAGVHFGSDQVEAMMQNGGITPLTVVRDTEGLQYRYEGRGFVRLP